ncbi:phosphoesterase [Erysipelothrix larvae]|uniref:Cyclic-di-AMP phosphodiesterase n=1 Tax=Erysipelothrix larvae TaxID=1514105 RepID=A0A0X8H1N2_9FIRM|nr:DHH family phosphoesterase [Erysipelothrix larvae]AMC94467.1 phosphoesterase [Erysipelothrix larvae]
MVERFEKYKTRIMLVALTELVMVVIFRVFLETWLVYIQYALILFNLLLVTFIFYQAWSLYKERVLTVSRALGKESGAAFIFGKLGFVTYDENGIITWMSEFFDSYKDLNVIGMRFLEIFPDARAVVLDGKEREMVNYEDIVFEVGALKSQGIVVFQDITELGVVRTQLKNNQVVIGIAHLDNYEDTTAYTEEQTVSYIDMNIRQAVVRWATQHNMFVRRIRPDRYLLAMDEKVFTQIERERFSILNDVRKASAEIDTSITLSLAFARKSDNYKELEDMSNRALELAQSRGGDQVAINTKNEQMRYFGGNSEAVEKRSKVRVRVIAHNLGEQIQKASNVIVVGHHIMDFDCIGSALGISSIVSVYDKPCDIVFDLNDTEVKLLEAFNNNREELGKHHRFTAPNQALEKVGDNTLVILVDHHSIEQTQGEPIIRKANKIIVIDHHRRTGEFTFKPDLVYIEPSASSASELIIELFPYHLKNVTLSKIDATFMYTGMLIDTNRFRNRSGSRTFEAAAELRKYGADLTMTENILRDEYDAFELKTRVLSHSELFEDGYVIAAYKDGIISRTIMSQVADDILKVRDVEASFVVSVVKEDTVGISARSKGDLNVQRVMERLGGGGHFTGAATQIVGQSINDVVESLKGAIREVMEEGD